MKKVANNNIENLAEVIIEKRKRIQHYREAAKIEEEDLKRIEQEFIKSLDKQGMRAIGFNNFYLGVQDRKYVKITDPKKLVTQLRRKGLDKLIKETVDKVSFNRVALAMYRSDKKLFAGTEIEESKTLYVRENKEKK